MTATDDATGEARTDVGLAGVDENELLKQWAIFVAGLFGIYALGNFLDALILGEALDVSLSGMSGTTWRSGLVPLVLGAAAAAYSTRPDAQLFKLLAAGIAAAILVVGLVETTVYTQVILDNGSMDYAALIQYVVVEIVSGVVLAVGAAWLVRNRTPDDVTY